jgi:hypothetical protein
MAVRRSHASYRLIGDGVDPAAITRALRIEPALALKRGQQLGLRADGSPRLAPTSVWLITSEGRMTDSEPLERHILELLQRLEPRRDELLRLSASPAVRGDFFCFLEAQPQGGVPTLSPALLRRLAAIGASLTLDTYESSEELGSGGAETGAD